MNTINVYPIGKIEQENNEIRIVLDAAYRRGLTGLRGFSHVQVLWWADRCGSAESRAVLTEAKPYRRGPDELGVFAVRSPERPNPIAVSSAEIAGIDEKAGTVTLCYIDAFPGTPVLDLKPYTPALDRVEGACVVCSLAAFL